MIDPAMLYDHLRKKGVDFFCGVPDSLLKNFLACIQQLTSREEHIITANEGLAIGLASGYHFGTGKLPLVYMQNSGLGNIINPLTSLADKEMYSVPMLLMIGWRGRPGTKDEPQHKKMGHITRELLNVLEVPVFELDGNFQNVVQQVDTAIEQATHEQRPVALLVAEEIFESFQSSVTTSSYMLDRKKIIQLLVSELDGSETVVCTTGKIGREFYEQNIEAGKKIKKYFLSVGAMGHASHIGLGLQRNLKDKLIMLDGDGALLMHLGALPTIADFAKDNFIHIVINNGSHESVGGQPTEGFFIDLSSVARSCGYRNTITIETETELVYWLKDGMKNTGKQFVEIKSRQTNGPDPGRPTGTPLEWKKDLMNAIIKNA